MSQNEEFMDMNEEILESRETDIPETEPAGSVSEEAEAQEAPAEETPEKKKEDWRKTLFKDLKEILVILGVFMLIYTLFFRVVVVKGGSMNDTLVDGDRLLLISGLLYQNPQRGDIVVAAKDSFRDGEPIIKRVIATEGQVVDIDFKTGAVYVDGELLYETYISTPTTHYEGVNFPVTVPEGCVFVMGDNRGDSLDSRSTQIGFIDEREILGKAVLLVFPGVGENGEYPFDITRIGGVN